MCEVAEKIYIQGEFKKARETAIKLYRKRWKETEIADLLNYGVDVIKGWINMALA